MADGLLLLQAGVFVLLLIGAGNLVNLLLVRASGRTREFAVRQALGASRLQLARALGVETLLLTAVAGALGLGLGLGALALRGIAIFAADRLPPDLVPALDRHTCLAAAGLSLALGLLLALPAAWQTLRGNLATSLALESRGRTTTRAVHRLRHGLIVAQIALAFVLLAGCGLLGLSFIRVMAVDPGFRQDNVLTGMITLPWVRYQDAEQRVTFVARLLAELRALPGVIAVGTSMRVPFAGIDGDDFTPIEIEGRSLAPGEAPEEQYNRGVTAEYFAAMGVPLRAGRFLTDDDAKASDKRCVIDEALAQRYWPAGDALGHRVTWGGGHPKKEDFSTIVGIVGAVKQNSLADRNGYGVVYYPSAVFSQLAFTVAVRTAQAPEAVATAARATVLRLDPELPLTDVQTMEDRIDDSLTGRRLPLPVAGTFAGIALLLAAVGIYGGPRLQRRATPARDRRAHGAGRPAGANPPTVSRPECPAPWRRPAARTDRRLPGRPNHDHPPIWHRPGKPNCARRRGCHPRRSCDSGLPAPRAPCLPASHRWRRCAATDPAAPGRQTPCGDVRGRRRRIALCLDPFSGVDSGARPLVPRRPGQTPDS